MVCYYNHDTDCFGDHVSSQEKPDVFSSSPRSQCRFVFKGGERFWRCRVELHLPQLSGSFEGIPAEAQECLDNL